MMVITGNLNGANHKWGDLLVLMTGKGPRSCFVTPFTMVYDTYHYN